MPSSQMKNASICSMPIMVPGRMPMARSMPNSWVRSKIVMMKVLTTLKATTSMMMAYTSTPPRASTSMAWLISGSAACQLRATTPGGKSAFRAAATSRLSPTSATRATKVWASSPRPKAS